MQCLKAMEKIGNDKDEKHLWDDKQSPEDENFLSISAQRRLRPLRKKVICLAKFLYSPPTVSRAHMTPYGKWQLTILPQTPGS